ncbi:ABC transporter ATP-binding protein [Listeria fleischmannii]|jgi:iron complex transport system ATP-binding protein|uniref:ABC transporter ATP-binding protein n=2 Tax=Listeria fleischmannii TaxID=1069827 RepID=A0A841YJ25_9LIST|nr:ABC transporter ATP-binding protein [Listeria fleischmannii]EIA18869.1 ABC transporter (ATP-binding protein) [Listeria fleischmannii subsp. coloradonensis]EUJ58860.1 putative ABC transporter ATP-binding protein [Listeria fleischmannii FSL S10-1203]MBC1399957.1 ABC transporter ATP-binding protein [Listeria fleischmannii]MBC1420062.1 ABC transporter ATP-binding protein [Listeria fleischmannii]MBC1428279.1 ABC transporter ATP-binding protein [Listeria fleischmannii]
MFEFQQVTFTRGEKQILKQINWLVNTGEKWAMLGLNGAGKTTLLKLLNGYIWPSSGKLQVLGEWFGETSLPELRKSIGWVSSAMQYQLKEYETAEQIVLSGKYASIGLYQPVSKAEMDQAKKILWSAGASSLIGKTYATLSQGERQLVLIARALMADPRLLILDEPCSGLDLFAREKLLHQVQKIATSDKTILFVTHHTEEILPQFTQTILLKNGEVFGKGSTSEMLSAKNMEKFYEHGIDIFKVANGRIAIYPNESYNG